MSPKIMGEIIILAIIGIPIYSWFLYLWLSNFKKVWNRNRTKALLPIIIALQPFFTLYIWFFVK